MLQPPPQNINPATRGVKRARSALE
jgi:hypothetical protein